ncbi:MAG: tetratricopeptide repeat protein [Coleofasciculaceae cyanobacterium RL_1_1]|nr:tetratricopeptide repeat protein [Coleofasciculaceae cyanobacterium RL_1_1]
MVAASLPCPASLTIASPASRHPHRTHRRSAVFVFPTATSIVEPTSSSYSDDHGLKRWLLKTSSQWLGLSPEFGRGNRWYRARQYDRAVESYDRALDLDPNLRSAWLRRGQALVKLERYSEAIESYDQAIALREDDVWGWLLRGRLLYERERFDEAANSLERAGDCDRHRPEVWIYLARSLERLNRFLDAALAYQQALVLRPTDLDLHLRCGSAFTACGRDAEAAKTYAAAIAIAPRPRRPLGTLRPLLSSCR